MVFIKVEVVAPTSPGMVVVEVLFFAVVDQVVFAADERLICQLCQKPGHSSDRCWYRFEQSFMPHSPSHHKAQHQQLHSLQPLSQLHSTEPISQPQQHPSANLAQSCNASSCYSPSEFNTKSSSWYPDSGATHHVSNDLANLNTTSEYHGGNSLHLGDNFGIPFAHVGESAMFTPPYTSASRLFSLKNLLHVPKVSKNILSVSHFAKIIMYILSFILPFVL